MRTHTEMKQPTNKAGSRIQAKSGRDSSTARGAALPPPAYGIDFVDRHGRGSEERRPGSTGQGQGLSGSPNRTGMPDRLKSGIEALSRMDMSDVRVHANSDKPAHIDALAYTQGNEIHLAPGQERHLPHEAWHVVQQRQGRVQATMQAKGRAINDDPHLEREADVMGAKAMDAGHAGPPAWGHQTAGTAQAPVQRRCAECEEEMSRQSVQRQPSGVIQRLAITNKGGAQGDCGEYQVRWTFSLSNPAPADGYIVQQIDFHHDKKGCDKARVNATPAQPDLTFWEAWFVPKGQTVDQTTLDDDWTDQSSQAGSKNTSGAMAARGEVKFFTKAKTGDLGDFGQAPANPVGGWGPGAEPQSGALPSTRIRPPWWNDSVEGPVHRWANAWWNCCGDKSEHFSKSGWNP